jgi:uncharacterized protein YqjF (DUF2071 family)
MTARIEVKVQPKAAMNTLLPLPLPARPADRAVHPDTGLLSAVARHRLLANRGEPLLTADWDRALMIHYEVDPAALRPIVPFPLDLRDGRAYVTLLAFTLRDMKPRRGGKLTEWLFRPIATHGFLNVRTYVRVGNETGTLSEWLMERYTAFTANGRHRRFFRVWHPTWLHTASRITVSDDSLLRNRWPWFAKARLIGANFSPGVRNVWMGRPHRLPSKGA